MLRNWWKRRGNILKKFRGQELEAAETGPLSNLQWEADYYLTPVPRNALFYEYLEMGKCCRIQYHKSNTIRVRFLLVIK